MKAVVCGAGIAGLTAAQCLSRHGWDVVVLERASGPRTQGYMIDCIGPGYDAAEAMGLLPRLREAGARAGPRPVLPLRQHRRATRLLRAP